MTILLSGEAESPLFIFDISMSIRMLLEAIAIGISMEKGSFRFLSSDTE